MSLCRRGFEYFIRTDSSSSSAEEDGTLWNFVPRFRSDGTQITPDGTPGQEFHGVPLSLLEFHRVPRSKFHVRRFTRNFLEPTTFWLEEIVGCGCIVCLTYKLLN